MIGKTKIRRVAFDQDGVLIADKAAWDTILGQKSELPPSLYRLYLKGELEYQHTVAFVEFFAREAGLHIDSFLNAARKMQLEPHIVEVVDILHRNGIGTDIVTLAPSIVAREIARRINPKAFGVEGNIARNVYGKKTLFDSRGNFTGIIFYPTKRGECWQNVEEISKLMVLDGIRAKNGLLREEVLFVSDGHDTEVSQCYPTVGYKHRNNTLRTVAEITDHRDLLRFI